MNNAPPRAGADSRLDVFGELLPLMEGNFAFLEELHLQAVTMTHQGLTSQAQEVFRLVRDNAGRFPQLRAWAAFKMAEHLLRSGDALAGQEALRQVLGLHPGHLKTRLLLQPADSPLRVCLGDEPHPDCPGLHVTFNENNPELWDYYFGPRPIDELWMTPPLRLLRMDARTLALAVERHLAPGARVVLPLGRQRRAEFDRSALRDLLGQGRPAFEAALDGAFRKLQR